MRMTADRAAWLFTARPAQALLLCALACAWVPISSAQRTPTREPRRVPVAVAMVDSASVGGQPYEIVRRTSSAPRDVILLPQGADEQSFSAAVSALLVIRAQQGDTASAPAIVRLRRRQTSTENTAFPWAGRVLRQLRAAEPRMLPEFGNVRWIEIWLPRARGRGRS